VNDEQSDAKIREILRKCSPRELEALQRFYLLEETPEKIQRDLDLTGVQLKDLKARIVAEFWAMKNPS
jgi:hypothetical protein